jgi:hypothetical protein
LSIVLLYRPVPCVPDGGEGCRVYAESSFCGGRSIPFIHASLAKLLPHLAGTSSKLMDPLESYPSPLVVPAKSPIPAHSLLGPAEHCTFQFGVISDLPSFHLANKSADEKAGSSFFRPFTAESATAFHVPAFQRNHKKRLAPFLLERLRVQLVLSPLTRGHPIARSKLHSWGVWSEVVNTTVRTD